jgi:hypothetical protein
VATAFFCTKQHQVAIVATKALSSATTTIEATAFATATTTASTAASEKILRDKIQECFKSVEFCGILIF